MNIVSVFIIEDFANNSKFQVKVEGAGENTINVLRNNYNRFVKVILDGFEINGNFHYLDI